MTPLRILRSFGLWNAGEVAGFPEDRVEELKRLGLAEQLPPDPPQDTESRSPRRGGR